MRTEDQIKALAALAGAPVSQTEWIIKNYPPDYQYHPNRYLTSYDAIIPLIKKQWKSTNTDEGVRWQFLFWNALMDSECMLFNSPAQLCEALLRATGKWKD